jgi:predicted Zn-dependent protease with MMP-like domain
MRQVMNFGKKQIDKWVVEAIEMVPKRLLKRMHNLVFMVDDYPTRSQIKECQLRRGYALFGLYYGYEQTSNRHAKIPDKISIFRKVILEEAKTPRIIKKRVYTTVWHEIAHHFGADEAVAERAEKRMFERYCRIHQKASVQKKEVKKISRVKKGRRGYKRKTKVSYKVNLA